MSCNVTNCKEANRWASNYRGTPRSASMYEVWKDEKIKRGQQRRTTHPSPFHQDKEATYSTFHRDFNLCPRHFLFSPIVLRRPFWSLPDSDSQFASLLWETPWRDDLEKAASEQRSCPPPHADTAPGLTGSARCARPAEPRSPKHNIPYPHFTVFVFMKKQFVLRCFS